MPTGNPSSAGTSKDSSARTNRISIVAKMAGHVSLIVIYHAPWKILAPLIIADSSMAGSMERNAAVMRRKAMGE